MNLKDVKFEPLGQYFYTLGERVRCNCDCHNPGVAMMHFVPCCEKEWIQSRVILTRSQEVDIIKSTIEKFKSEKWINIGDHSKGGCV